MTEAPVWRPYDRTPLPPSEQGPALVRCMADPVYFADRFWPCWSPEAGEMVHFGCTGQWAASGFFLGVLHDYPGHTLWSKSRGIGMSTMFQVSDAHRICYNERIRGVVASRNDDQAKYFMREMVASVRLLKEIHPYLLPEYRPLEKIFSIEELASEYHSVPHSPDTARGGSFSFGTSDELSAWEYADEAFTSSMMPAIGGRGGRVKAGGTPRAGTLHERLVIRAKQIDDPFAEEDPWWPDKIDPATGEPIPFPRRRWLYDFGRRIGWNGRHATKPYPVAAESGFLLLQPHYSYYPFRDEAWARQRFIEMGQDIPRWCEEYELSPDAASRHVFDLNAVIACEALPTAHPGQPAEGRFREGWLYSFGADPAEGLAHGDHTAIYAAGVSPDLTGYAVAKYTDGALSEAEAAHLLAQWCYEAIRVGAHIVVVPEANKSAMLAIFLECYPDLEPAVLRHEDALAAFNRGQPAVQKLGTASRATGRLGVLTSATTKRQIVGLGQQVVLARRLPIPPIPALRYQIRRFQFQSTETSRSVKIQAPQGEHDDFVMAWLFHLIGLAALTDGAILRPASPIRAQTDAALARTAPAAVREVEYDEPLGSRRDAADRPDWGMRRTGRVPFGSL